MAKKIDLKVLSAKYAGLVAQEANLKAEKEVLQAQIKEGMKGAGADKIETNYGVFTLYQRKTWEYSPAIKNEYETLKLKEKGEQESGVAQATVSESLRFTPIKG